MSDIKHKDLRPDYWVQAQISNWFSVLIFSVCIVLNVYDSQNTRLIYAKCQQKKNN